MLWWIVDNALWLYLLLGFAAAALAYVWWSNRQGRYLIALGVTLSMLLLVWLLTLWLVTDRMQLQNIIREMASAVEKQDPERLVRHLSPQFRAATQGGVVLTKKAAEDIIRKYIRHYHLDDIYVSQFTVSPDRSKGKARVEFLARVGAHGDILDLSRIKAEFALEGGQWRMVSFQRFDPYLDKASPLPSP